MLVLAIAAGWKAIGVCVLVLLGAGLLGVATFDRPTPRARRLRVMAGIAAGVAALVVLVVLLVGPGPWCEAGDAYHVPGCA